MSAVNPRGRLLRHARHALGATPREFRRWQWVHPTPIAVELRHLIFIAVGVAGMFHEMEFAFMMNNFWTLEDTFEHIPQHMWTTHHKNKLQRKQQSYRNAIHHVVSNVQGWHKRNNDPHLEIWCKTQTIQRPFEWNAQTPTMSYRKRRQRHITNTDNEHLQTPNETLQTQLLNNWMHQQ